MSATYATPQSIAFASGGGATSGTSTPLATAGYYALAATVEIVVVGTPTAAAQFVPQWSFDGIKYYGGQPLATNLAAGTYDFNYLFPPGTANVQFAYTQQAGGTSSTLTGQVAGITG